MKNKLLKQSIGGHILVYALCALYSVFGVRYSVRPFARSVQWSLETLTKRSHASNARRHSVFHSQVVQMWPIDAGPRSFHLPSRKV